jgi:ATP-dependent exoDNAse (exonuclease V) beta subunit
VTPGATNLRERFTSLLHAHERALVDDVERCVDRAIASFEALATDAELSGASTVLREVPFSLRRDDGTIVRGAIDAIAEYPDNRIEVIEFKTGGRRREHDDQLAVYIQAARVLFPEKRVDGRFIYAADGQLSDGRGV